MGEAFELGGGAAAQGTTPLLAYGSNATREGLHAKLQGDGARVLAARLRGFDAVYSAHLTGYGALPATLQRQAATTLRVSVVMLTREQLRVLDATEPNYVGGWLEGVEIELDGGVGLSRAWCYVSRHGCLADQGRELAVGALWADGRVLSAIDQREALTLARDRLSPRTPLERFVADAVADPALARRHTERLREDAIAFRWSGFGCST